MKVAVSVHKPATMDVNVQTVQFVRREGGELHIQHAGAKQNRNYGYAIDTKTPSGYPGKLGTPSLPSLAGTDRKYFPGSIVWKNGEAVLLGPSGFSASFEAPAEIDGSLD